MKEFEKLNEIFSVGGLEQPENFFSIGKFPLFNIINDKKICENRSREGEGLLKAGFFLYR